MNSSRRWAMTRCRCLTAAPCVIHGINMAERTSKVLTVSLPPDAASEFERIAREEGRNKSELFREMLRIYRGYRETQTFDGLQRYGARQARSAGIKDERDVERLIQEFRHG